MAFVSLVIFVTDINTGFILVSPEKEAMLI